MHSLPSQVEATNMATQSSGRTKVEIRVLSPPTPPPGEPGLFSGLGVLVKRGAQPPSLPVHLPSPLRHQHESHLQLGNLAGHDVR